MSHGYGRRDGLLRWIILAAGVVAVLLLAYQGGRWLESRDAKPETRGNYQQRYEYEETIEVGGESYRKRRNLTTILLMGIDRDSEMVSSGYRNGGQADFLRVVVLDSARRTITQLQIDRDTMTPITILGVLGNQSGVRTSQICLSHGFGDGGARSCELTESAVSNLLFGVDIDFYAAMNLDGISVLNDWAGGVEVTIEDDFSAVDPAMTIGTTLTLVGDQAETYVRTRRGIGVGTNEARMKRQQVYISRLTTQLDEKLRANQNAVGELYDALSDYLQTDMSRGRMINEMWAARDYERQPLLTPEGTYQLGEDGFMQFLVDEDKLQEMVLGLFYEKVNK